MHTASIPVNPSRAVCRVPSLSKIVLGRLGAPGALEILRQRAPLFLALQRTDPGSPGYQRAGDEENEATSRSSSLGTRAGLPVGAIE